MFKKSNILALAGALALGVAMLSPVSADARGFGGGHGGGGHGGGFHGGGFHGGGFHGGGIRVGFRHHHFRPHWNVGFRRHYWVAPALTYAVARPAIAAVPGPCTCLSKEYTPEGVVVFKDRCTNEMAMNPPAAAPQQTSYQTAPAQVYQTAPVQQPQQAYVPTYPGPAAQPVAR